MANILAIVWAGAVHLLHGHLEWLSRQIFPDTSDPDILADQAAMYGITPIPATYASGSATATGTDGATIPTATVLVSPDGVEYTVTADATIASGTATLAIQAVLAGKSGNLLSGDTLSFESPITNVDPTVTIPDDIRNGEDQEDVGTKMRDRFILHLQEPPEGGAEHDYIEWALAVAGVTRVWVYRYENGLGTVVVRFVMDDNSPIFPDSGQVDAVQAALDSERPITADVTAVAPTELATAFNISLTPNTVAVQNAVTDSLTDLFLRKAEPGDGAGRGTVLLSHMLTAIGVSDGVEDFTLNSPSADVIPALGELPTLGTITWA